ncbi:MAG TPA: FKBP-type peptidyl-prolyl cis-trans isomerase [Myxococcota bacterium]
MQRKSRSRFFYGAWLLLLVSAVLPLASSAQPTEQDAESPGADPKTVLYALGVAVGQQLKQFALSPEEFEVVNQGLRDSALDRPLQADPYDLREELAALGVERQAVQANKERAAARDFVARAAREEGSVQTQSGLVIRELVAGTGASPQQTSVVRVHYHGTLRDGMVFDSTLPAGTPATFRLDRVIPCWQEGLQRMKVGGRSRLVCPPTIAYGDSGYPPMIPPAAALVFEVELVEIVE